MRSLLISLAVVLSLCALSKAGNVFPKAACNVTADCVANADCMIPAPCDDGTCECKSTHYIKADKCEAKIANGEACTSVGAAPECVSGMCKGGNCFVMGAVGADCTDGTDCTSGYCKAGTPTNKCAAKLAFDDVCTVDGECMTGKCGTVAPKKCVCGDGFKPGSGNTKCVPEVDLDADCGTGTNAADCAKGRLPGSTTCETGAKCLCKHYKMDDVFCSAQQAYDGACTADTDCETGKCTSNKCECKAKWTWDATNKKCVKDKIAKDQACVTGDMCAVSDQTCVQCNGDADMKCQTNKQTDNTTDGATMIAVSLTTLFTSILALVL